MSPSPHVRVEIDLRRVRENAEGIRRETGVPLIAVVKADAYGLGAEQITRALAEAADGFCVFDADEARRIDLWNRTGKPALAIGPPTWEADDYLLHHVRPAVSNASQAARLKAARPVLCVNTGQQRFACDVESVPATLREGDIDEAFTHATSLAQVEILRNAVSGRVSRMHAAGSSLLHELSARLDAVRPGLAIYRGAARVSTRLVETRKGNGPAGYGGFIAPWHGVIRVGYFNGLHAGPCLVNGRPSQILEVGMQSAFVEVSGEDQAGDEVVLLGDGLTEQAIADDWNTSPHECLVRLTDAGVRTYSGGPRV
jgi:alanine racemase